MLVSAISSNMVNNIPSYNKTEINRDTSFNSLKPYFSRKNNLTDEDAPIVYDSINQWKRFCENKVLGEKLNILA